ncbi:hypothetical protein CRE_19813 [Caenorhabditis remanei]|uniref:CUB-like domain-containing protein n=1 Tax=Caenorhabditis remanei TaxID=31234 RepID=E3MTF6_CAERE|nr:hypothetical protein CRE_19813 [Caenorhabditis remanei]
MSSTLLFFALFSICSCQVLLNLRDFNGGNAKNRLNPGPDQTGVYVSAFSDSVDLLSKIFIVFGNNGTQTSIYDLKGLRLTTGEIIHCIIDNSTYLTTSLSNNQMTQLTGMMFISSPRQLVDINFHVMDASYQLDIQFKKIDPVDSTVLFLNTNFNVNPSTTSVISQWTQYEGSSVYLYSGYHTR